MIVAKELLLYMPWWFWLYSFLVASFILREIITKRNEEPLIIFLSYPFLLIGFMLMMMDKIINKTNDLVIYSPKVMNLMLACIIVSVILIGIGLYQKRKSDKYNVPKIQFTKVLKLSLLHFIIHVLIVIILIALLIFLKEYLKVF